MQIIEEISVQLFNLLAFLLKALFAFLKMIISGIPINNKEYKASFASPCTLLSSRHTGFCLTGKRNLSVKDSYQNAIVIGGTGTGKSSVVLIPSIYTMQSSLVIHDPSGELYSKTAGMLKNQGYVVKQLNFAQFDHSGGYNPLERANSSTEIQKVASMLIENALGGKGGTKDPFWSIQSISLLSMLITIVKKQEKAYQNLFNVRQLLNQLSANPESVDLLFSKYADEILFAEYKSFLAYDDKVVSGVIATCKAALQIFSDESVAQVTSSDSIVMQDFRNKKVALFIQNSVADQKYYSILTSIFFEQFFSFVMSRFPEKQELDIFLLIDEASSLNLPTLSLAVANVRKHRAGIMLLLQDFNQLVHLYGKHQADGIKANCFAKMYFTGQSLESTKELEQTLGKYEYQDDKKQKVIRSLMTNDEIRTMKATRAILICGNNRPIMARLKPYYKKGLYREFSLLPVSNTEREIQFIKLSVLPMPTPHVQKVA